MDAPKLVEIALRILPALWRRANKGSHEGPDVSDRHVGYVGKMVNALVYERGVATVGSENPDAHPGTPIIAMRGKPRTQQLLSLGILAVL